MQYFSTGRTQAPFLFLNPGSSPSLYLIQTREIDRRKGVQPQLSFFFFLMNSFENFLCGKNLEVLNP